MNRNRKSGFTLIELLVVVLIIAILAAIALPLYLNATRDAEHRAARSNMRAIATAEQAYRVQHLDYTSKLSDLQGDLGRDFGDTKNLAGPGNRSYEVHPEFSGKDPQCAVNGETDPKTGQSTPTTGVTVPEGGIVIKSVAGSDASDTEKTRIGGDGCYVPGLSTQ